MAAEDGARAVTQGHGLLVTDATASRQAGKRVSGLARAGFRRTVVRATHAAVCEASADLLGCPHRWIDPSGPGEERDTTALPLEMRGTAAMSRQTPSYCRARADECERLAAKALSPDTREIMTYLALRWRELAEHDETEKKPFKPKTRTLSPSF